MWMMVGDGVVRKTDENEHIGRSTSLSDSEPKSDRTLDPIFEQHLSSSSSALIFRRATIIPFYTPLYHHRSTRRQALFGYSLHCIIGVLGAYELGPAQLGGTALLGGGLDWMRDMITINELYIIITGYLG
jgi:hypothetical protein